MKNEATFAGIFAELSSLVAAASRDVALYTLVIGGLGAVGVVAGLGQSSAESLDFGFSIDSSDSPGSALFELLSAIASLAATYLLLTRYLAVGGRSVATGRFWPYIGMAILSAIGAFLGFILLIVPGIILLVRWSAASGFVIGAGQGVTESLSSSWAATRGHSWAIFFSAIVLFLGIVVIAGVAGGVLSAVSGTIGGVISAFIEAAASAIFVGYGIAIYRVVRGDGDEVSAVFA